MKQLRQIVTVVTMSMRGIPWRLGSSCVVVIGIAGVVGVLVSVLGMRQGLSEAALATGQPDRAIVLRGGARSEMASTLPAEAGRKVMDAPGVAHTAAGDPVISAEVVTAVNLPRHRDGKHAGLTVRGVGPQAFTLRPEVRLVGGRMFQPGLRELIVGHRAQLEFLGVAPGDEVTLRDGTWTVVGVYESAGNAFESALLTDADTLLSAYQRTLVNSVTVLLDSAAALQPFKDALTADPTLSVTVLPEQEYYSQQAREIEGLLGLVTGFVAFVMAVGAIFAALNTMYSAVSARLVEIATLRAIGFGPTGVVVSVLVEALILAAFGALLGTAISWLLFHGNMISMGGVTGSMVFEVRITFSQLVAGMSLAGIVGFLGGLLPAIRAARLPVATALRTA